MLCKRCEAGVESSDRSGRGEVVTLFGAERGEPRAGAPRPARILIVDDQFVGRHILQSIVRGLEWEVDGAMLVRAFRRLPGCAAALERRVEAG